MEATDDNNDILMSEEIGASEEIPSADSTSESAIRIQRLHAVEKVPTKLRFLCDTYIFTLEYSK